MPVVRIYIHPRKRTINCKDLCQNFNRCHLKMVRLYVIYFFHLLIMVFKSEEPRFNLWFSPLLYDLGQVTLPNA